jgi:hypothetical protein
MNRRFSIAAAFVLAMGSFGLSLASCNAPSCGPGTVQAQQKDGTLKCIQDTPASLTPCDVDGGDVMIVGGKCVSAVHCDTGTTMNDNGVCVGTSGGGATCHSPKPGTACISGTIHIELYDPIALLAGGTPSATADSTDGGSYVIQDFTVPSLGLIVVVTGNTTPGMIKAGAAAKGVSKDVIYHLDTYAIAKADSDKWGFDIATDGAQIAKFYSDSAPSPTNIVANETMPVAGVTLTKDGAPAGAKYFNATLTAVDPALTVTGASGVAIVASPVSGASFPTFSGQGGQDPAGMPITWEQLQGGSAAGLVLITRFHPSM